MRRGIPLLCIGLGVVGLIVSLYLAYVSSLPYCPPTLSECDVVVTSEYAYIDGVSVALLGAAWFIVAIVFSAACLFRKTFGKILFVWGLLGVAGVGYLVYIEIGVLHAICLYCTVAHVLGLAITVASIFMIRG